MTETGRAWGESMASDVVVSYFFEMLYGYSDASCLPLCRKAGAHLTGEHDNAFSELSDPANPVCRRFQFAETGTIGLFGIIGSPSTESAIEFLKFLRIS
jgi:hypothetical protein